MIRFNENSVIAGYIKQFLHTFNLPTIPVYQENKTKLINGNFYIKDSNIVQFTGYKDAVPLFVNKYPYIFNKRYEGLTKTLKINNILYDSHTHEYLGDYLRFIRDYQGLDLMSLYNCFSDTVVENLAIILDENLVERISGKREALTFEESDNYKIYKIPVKLGKKYTIGITSDTSYELMCALYGKGHYQQPVKSSTEISQTDILEYTTYTSIGGSNFNEPYIFDKLLNLDAALTAKGLTSNYLIDHEDSLCLLIKLPLSNSSTITILEGDYLGYNDRSIQSGKIRRVKNGQSTQETSLDKWVNNKTLYSLENREVLDNVRLISPLQLLYLNSNVSHPFADRLLEYLCDNAITPWDSISDNIKKLQQTLLNRYYTEKPKAYEGKDSSGNDEWISQGYYGGIDSYGNYYGTWEDYYKYVLYDIANQEGVLDNKFDILGYVDKDLEAVLDGLEQIDIYGDPEKGLHQKLAIANYLLERRSNILSTGDSGSRLTLEDSDGNGIIIED